MSNIDDKKWSKAIDILTQHGFTDIIKINMDNTDNKNMVYTIAHKFRDVIILPYVAINNNYQFLINKNNNPVVKTTDGIMCNAINIEEKIIFDLEQDIEQIYGITAWNWLKKWNRANIGMSDMIMVKMELKKIE